MTPTTPFDLTNRPIEIVWFDDNLDRVQPAYERLSTEGVTVRPFATLADTRRHLENSVNKGVPDVPDVLVTDLQVDQPSELGGLEDGIQLAAFADELYYDRLGVRGRIGIASAYPLEIQKAWETDAVEVAFAYATSDIVDGKFTLFSRQIHLEASRLRRDLWCRQYERDNNLTFDTLGGRFSLAVFYGVITRITTEYVFIDTWTIDSIRSECTRRFLRRQIEQAGRYEIDQPVRLVEVTDTTHANCLSASIYIYPMGDVCAYRYLDLDPDLDFTCFANCHE